MTHLESYRQKQINLPMFKRRLTLIRHDCPRSIKSIVSKTKNHVFPESTRLTVSKIRTTHLLLREIRFLHLVTPSLHLVTPEFSSSDSKCSSMPTTTAPEELCTSNSVI